MTEKVKVTQEEANGLDFLMELSNQDIDEALTRLGAVTYNQNAVIRDENLEIIEPLRLSDRHRTLFNALQYGYEVESEPLKVGDWVTEHEGEGYRTGKVWITHDGGWVTVRFLGFKNPSDFYNEKLLMSEVSKSTDREIHEEKERWKWAKIGRRVGEFRDGDYGEHASGRESSDSQEYLNDWYKRGRLKGFYPAESFINFEEVEPDATTHN